MEVKGCSKRNRWHFCENIGTVWNGVRPALRCLDITCLCILSFLLNDFSQTEQNQLMSAQEQNVDWERERMLRIYIGFQAIKFYCFPPPKPPLPPPPPPLFCCFLSSSSSSSSFVLFFTSSSSSSFYCFSSFSSLCIWLFLSLVFNKVFWNGISLVFLLLANMSRVF